MSLQVIYWLFHHSADEINLRQHIVTHTWNLSKKESTEHRNDFSAFSKQAWSSCDGSLGMARTSYHTHVRGGTQPSNDTLTPSTFLLLGGHWLKRTAHQSPLKPRTFLNCELSTLTTALKSSMCGYVCVCRRNSSTTKKVLNFFFKRLMIQSGVSQPI